MKSKEELKSEWVAALHSGKYEQGTNYLKIEGRHCCLGVLCDVIDPDRWGPKDYDVGENFVNHRVEKWGDDTFEINETIRDALGMTEEFVDQLIRMNDVEKADFPTIANYIEEHL